MLILLVFSQIFLMAHTTATSECLIREYGADKKVCVCNSDHCDNNAVNITPFKVNIFTSTQDGARYKKSVKNLEKSASTQNLITIDRKKKYQRIIGFGGAITDSTGISINSLPAEAISNLMRSYFSEEGSLYNLCRIPMGGSDYSTHFYSLDDGPEDPNLENFKLTDEDYNYKIPLMKMANELSNFTIKFFSSSWTAPKWIKENGDYLGGYLKKEYYQTWANYHLKFLEEYKKQGIEYWGVTTANEATFMEVTRKIPAVKWEPEQLSVWIRDNLGPTLRSSEFAKTKLLTIDDQRMILLDYLEELMQNETTRSYVDGFAIHWYMDLDNSSTILTDTHERYPKQFLLYSEASDGFRPEQKPMDIGSWDRAEDYASDIIDNLNHWVTGWVDWNMALNTEGGPNAIGNSIDSPIIVNATAGEFYKNPMYYAIGHFSKFIPVESSVIHVNTTVDLPFVAITTPTSNEKVVLVILNKDNNVLPISVQDGSKYVNLVLEKKSITTVIY